jgi:hypothetical protein
VAFNKKLAWLEQPRQRIGAKSNRDGAHERVRLDERIGKAPALISIAVAAIRAIFGKRVLMLVSSS